MKCITGNSNDDSGRVIGAWHHHQTNEYFAPPYSAIAWLDKDGKIIFSAIFNDYHGPESSIEFHICGKLNIFKRGIYRKILDYSFNELECTVLRAKPRRSHKIVIQSLPRLGFTLEAELESYYGASPDNDALVFKLKREQASDWLKTLE